MILKTLFSEFTKQMTMRTLKLLVSLIFFFIILQSEVFGQSGRDSTRNERRNNASEPSWRDRVRFGGNFGLQFGNITFIDISPLVLYGVTDRLQLGVGVTYQYIRFNFPTLRTSGNSIYGGRVFTRYFLFPGVFAQAEYETLSTRYYDAFTNEIKRALVPAGFIGGGYSQQAGGRAAINVTILYNLLYEQYKFQSVYASPWVVRVGFNL
jgi:hypothetical protein